MKLKNILFVVEDIEKSKSFYRDLFGLFLEKLKHSDLNIEYINTCMEHDWGQRVMRIYDPRCLRNTR